MTSSSSPVPHRTLAAWCVVAMLMTLTLWLHLLPALLGGLAVYELVAVWSRWLRFTALGSDRARTLAVALLGAAVISLLTLAALGAASFLRHGSANIPALLQKLADVVDGARPMLPAWLAESLPESPEALRQTLTDLMRQHTGALSIAGREFSRALAHVLVGMILGALLALRGTSGTGGRGPLAAIGIDTARRFGDAFRRVVFAQAWIATVNALCTAVYLAVLLPLFGVHLPLLKTLILVTWIAGLVPIVGNLISNTIIVGVSLTHSLTVAIASLAFLLAVHKAEYFLNARIIGTQIRARAWELLLAMLVMEAAFGLAGVIAAPIFYAYFKGEFSDHHLI